jgi:hypothetical protein
MYYALMGRITREKLGRTALRALIEDRVLLSRSILKIRQLLLQECNSRMKKKCAFECAHGAIIMKFRALTQLACATLLFQTLSLSQGVAAEITCVATWETGPDSSSVDPPQLALLYPSGRRPKPTTCTRLLIKGTLQTNDSETFLKVLSLHHPFVKTVLLWSPGGSVVEAMKIGRIVRKNMLVTHAPFSENNEGDLGSLNDPNPRRDFDKQLCAGKGCNCASACFLIWASGIERVGSAIGLHRPTINSTDFTDLPPDQGSSAYREILSGVEQFLLEMEVPQRVVDKMMATASDNITWLNQYPESWSWLSKDDRYSLMHVPSISEFLVASCGSLSEEEKKSSRKLAELAVDNIPLSAQRRSQEDRLSQRVTAIGECKEIRIESFRDSSPTPRSD